MTDAAAVPEQAEVELAAEWLTLHAHRRATPCATSGSNTIATVVSRWAGRTVTSEAVRAAALALGYVDQPIKRGPGWIFNVTVRPCCATCGVFTRSMSRSTCAGQEASAHAARVEIALALLDRLIVGVDCTRRGEP